MEFARFCVTFTHNCVTIFKRVCYCCGNSVGGKVGVGNFFSRVRCLSPGMANQWAIPAGEFVRGLCRRRRGNGGVESQHKSVRKRGRCQFGYPSTPMGLFSPE